MKHLFIFAVLVLIGVSEAAAQGGGDEAASPPKTEAPAPAEQVKAAPAAVEPAKEAPKAQAPKASESKKKDVEPAGKPAAAPQPAALSPEQRTEAEWKFLSDQAQSSDGEILDGVIEQLKVFVGKRLDAPMRPDALFLLAGLRQKRGDVKGGLIDLLRLAYEYPESKFAMKARSDFLDGAARKFSRRYKAAEEALVKVPKSDDKAERLAVLAENLGGAMDDSMYDASVEQIHHFQTRFPDYAESDDVQWALGQLHDKAGHSHQALVAYGALLAVYPESEFRSKAQFSVGVICADNLKDYKKAVDAFSEVVEKYPGSPEVLPALERSSQLYSERLKQYQLAVEIDEKIIKLFPKTDGALRAFKDEAKLQSERLKAPQDAIKTDQRLAEMFPGSAVEALQDAATIAHKDMKDYKQEVEIRHGIAKNYASSKEAPEELFNAAEVCHDDLKDVPQAVALYKELVTTFPKSKQAKKAQSRIDKLDDGSAPAPAPAKP